jgi:hypothetical protein
MQLQVVSCGSFLPMRGIKHPDTTDFNRNLHLLELVIVIRRESSIELSSGIFDSVVERA